MPDGKSKDTSGEASTEIARKIERTIAQTAKARLSKTAIPRADELAFDIAASSADDVVEMVMAYSGPVPPPGVIAGWERELPGSADRILRMAEKQQDADIARARLKFERDDAFRTKGLYFGAAVILLLLAVAALALFSPVPWIAGVIVGTGIVAIVIAYFNMTHRMSHGANVASETVAPRSDSDMRRS